MLHINDRYYMETSNQAIESRDLQHATEEMTRSLLQPICGTLVMDKTWYPVRVAALITIRATPISLQFSLVGTCHD